MHQRCFEIIAPLRYHITSTPCCDFVFFNFTHVSHFTVKNPALSSSRDSHFLPRDFLSASRDSLSVTRDVRWSAVGGARVAEINVNRGDKGGMCCRKEGDVLPQKRGRANKYVTAKSRDHSW